MRKKRCNPEEEYGLIDLSEPVDDNLNYYNENDDDDEVDIVEKIVSTPVKKVEKQKIYVDPKEFDAEIKLYYANGIISNNLAEMISKISHKLSFAGNFINYSYREEMVGDGIVRMMKALIAKKYDHTKANNPFSYFTKIAFNAFRNRIKKEKHIHEAHEKYQEQFNLLSSNYNTITKNKNSRLQPTQN